MKIVLNLLVCYVRIIVWNARKELIVVKLIALAVGILSSLLVILVLIILAMSTPTTLLMVLIVPLILLLGKSTLPSKTKQ